MGEAGATVEIPVAVPIAHVRSAIRSAVINYWGAGSFDEDGQLVVTLHEAHKGQRELLLTELALLRGLVLLAHRYPERFGRVLHGCADADDGDELLQLSLFGEVVYG